MKVQINEVRNEDVFKQRSAYTGANHEAYIVYVVNCLVFRKSHVLCRKIRTVKTVKPSLRTIREVITSTIIFVVVRCGLLKTCN